MLQIPSAVRGNAVPDRFPGRGPLCGRVGPRAAAAICATRRCGVANT